ncbi:MAG TPA: 16S rRNA (guanine(527)-N(7))-methyltransferase RsmG [Bacteroidales bacterium]|nr:16S rRNA (guanine(527)-N(7))-methyltransferase RsmG [Bacteroidales bacterium]HPT13087.1 16S rRNA (guanine(527)-N(7))-methyltransferase RsmG [Bacteroidales bacterium]
MTSVVSKYFPSLQPQQYQQLSQLAALYSEWNNRINVISRKDIDNFDVNHLLHSLAIAKFITFKSGTNIIDVGTGGGLPGIPLAIMFPETNFTLIDSVAKKIKVASAIADEIGLKNVKCIATRSEEMKGSFDFVVCRAVTEMKRFIAFTSHLLSAESFNPIPNGYIALKGGDLKEELSFLGKKVSVEDISQWYTESFFETKRIIYIPFQREKK